MSDNDEEFRDSFETVRSRGKTSAESKSGWAVLSAFSSTAHSTRPAITPASVTAKKDFSPLTKLLIVLVPIVLLFGYYSYSQFSGATFFGYFSPKPSINLTDGLVAHWTFDGLDVTDKIYDKSGNGHDAYFSNGATSSAKIAGKIGQAFNFDGIDDRVQFTPIATGETFTITGWIKPSGQIASWGHIIGQDSNNCFQYVKSTKKLLMNYSGGGYSYNSTPLKDNEWSFVGIVVSSRNGTFYLNGNPDGTKTGILSSNYDDIGYHGDEAFKGGIDDLRFYNRALSDEEMKALYALTKTTKIGTPPTPSNLENGLVGHWTFDGPDVSSTTAFEKGGNISINAFISSGVKPGIGKIGQGLLFSETDQTLIVPKTSAINNLNVVTYSFWAKVASNDMLSKFFWSYNPQTGSIFQTFSTGSEFWSANLAGAGLSVPLKDDTWYHHVITYDKTSASNNPTLYINGRKIVLTRLFNKTGTVVDDSTSDLKLVFLNTRGTVDDFRIYNRILSPKEVTQLYQLGAGSTIKICKEASVKDADGNDYNTLAIGSQCWLDRNMNVGTRIDNKLGQTNNGTIDKYCYSNNSANCTTNHPNKPDGGLYQWNEAMQYSATEGAHGICPVGFHIPTHAEWLTLGKYLTTKYWGSAVQPGGNSGFEANRAGYGFSVSFFDRSSYSYFWTSSVSSSQARYLLFWTSVYTSFTYIKSNYLSVRCIQD